MACERSFFSSSRRHTRCALVTGVQTCALPISGRPGIPEGMPPYKDENLIMLSAAARLASPMLAEQLGARSIAFHSAIATHRSSAVAPAARLAQPVAALKAAFAPRGSLGTHAFAVVDSTPAHTIHKLLTDHARSPKAAMGGERGD